MPALSASSLDEKKILLAWTGSPEQDGRWNLRVFLLPIYAASQPSVAEGL